MGHDRSGPADDPDVILDRGYRLEIETRLHVGGQKARNIRDLALLCSNCHRMIHTKPPWPTPAELRELIRRQPGNGGMS